MVIDNIHTANSITRAVGSLVIDSFSKTGHKKGKGTLEEVPLPLGKELTHSQKESGGGVTLGDLEFSVG
jgi:hypothetical protein